MGEKVSFLARRCGKRYARRCPCDACATPWRWAWTGISPGRRGRRIGWWLIGDQFW